MSRRCHHVAALSPCRGAVIMSRRCHDVAALSPCRGVTMPPRRPRGPGTDSSVESDSSRVAGTSDRLPSRFQVSTSARLPSHGEIRVHPPRLTPSQMPGPELGPGMPRTRRRRRTPCAVRASLTRIVDPMKPWRLSPSLSLAN